MCVVNLCFPLSQVPGQQTRYKGTHERGRPYFISNHLDLFEKSCKNRVSLFYDKFVRRLLR